MVGTVHSTHIKIMWCVVVWPCMLVCGGGIRDRGDRGLFCCYLAVIKLTKKRGRLGKSGCGRRGRYCLQYKSPTRHVLVVSKLA